MPRNPSKSTTGNHGGRLQKIASLAAKLEAEGRIPTPAVLVRSLVAGFAEVADPHNVHAPIQLARGESNPYHVVFVSTNDRDEPSTIQEAKKHLAGPQMKKLESLTPNGGSGIGFWSDGAEESRIVHVKNPDKLERVAAHLGKRFNQKAVIGFRQGDGSDLAHVLLVRGKTPEQIHDELMKHGVEYKTIIPMTRGSLVHILDNGGSLDSAIDSYAKQAKADHRRIPGTISFIGADTREQARQEYDRILKK